MQRMNRKEFQTLERLDKEKTISTLAKELKWSIVQFSRKDGIIDNLKDMNFIQIKKGKDKRFKIISLTNEGRKFLRIWKAIKWKGGLNNEKNCSK